MIRPVLVTTLVAVAVMLERAWAPTHRLGGRLMVVPGLAIVATTLLGFRGAALFGVVGAGTAIRVVVLSAYSYVVWRSDPERRPFNL